MAGAVFPPCSLFGLRLPSPGAYRLLGGVNGSFQEGSCQWVLPRSAAASVFAPPVSHSHPPPLQETLQYQQVVWPTFLWGTAFFPWVRCAQVLCVPSKGGVSVSPSPVIPVIKPRWPSKPYSLGAPPPIARPPGWEAWQAAIYMFLEQPTHSMWELGWEKRTLPSKYWEFVPSSLTAVSDHRGADKEVAAIVVALPPPHCWKTLSH